MASKKFEKVPRNGNFLMIIIDFGRNFMKPITKMLFLKN